MPPSSSQATVTGQALRRALVVHSGGVHVLAAARSLHAAGWEVGVASAHGALAHSRAVHRDFSVPPPERDPDGFVAAVAALVAEHGYDVVFGADDIEVLPDGEVPITPTPTEAQVALIRAFDPDEMRKREFRTR